MKRFSDSVGFALLLNMILPGAGHVYRREYLFGIFVLLVMLVASVLFFFSLLVTLPTTVLWVLFGLPTIFYVFSYVDLWRSIKKRADAPPRSNGTALIFLVVASAVNLAAPLSPTNLFLRNTPQAATLAVSDMEPILKPGAIVWVDRAAYRINLFFLDQPLPRAYPDRWDPVRFVSETDETRIGLVVGLPGEEVTIINDSLFVDGFPEPDRSGLPLRLEGELPLTLVASDRIMAVTLDNGVVEQIHQIPVRNVIGKVRWLF